MQRKQLFLFALCLSLAAHLYASIPSGYYTSASGKQGAALKTALASIIKSGHSAQSYAGVWTAYKTTDLRSDGKIWDRYSSITNYSYGSKGGEGGACGSYSAEGSCYNREHSWPKSWFGCSSPSASVPASTDLHQVVPTDGYVNNTRGANIFGVVKTASKTYSNAKFGTGGYGSHQSYTVFEPADEYKGDFARIYFYMVTRYQDNLSSWYSSYSSTDVSKVIDGSTYPAFQTWYLEMLLAWAKADPVDSRETARNDAVYGIQKNRNPFIDFPGLEDYIWGDHKTTNVDLTNYTDPYSGSGSTTVSAPTISPNGGSNTIGTNVSVTLSCSTSGATIYYTTNGSTPTSSSTKYTAAFNVTSASTGTVTVKAIAIKDGTSSSVTTANFVFSESGSSSGGGSNTQLLYESFSEYTASNDGSSAILTTNENLDYDNWATFSRVYLGGGGCGKLGASSNAGSMTTGSITLTGNATLTFKVRKYGSDTGSLNVTVTGAGATATGDTSVTPSSSSTWQNCTVNITGATGSITIQFATSTKRAYIDEIILVSSSSSVTPEAPTFSPDGGTYTSAQTVTISSTTSGATIRYTTDGTTPTATTGTTLSNGGTVSISESCTLKAVAVLSGTASSVTSGTYTINIPQVATPTFSPAAGTYSAAQSVTISCSTSGATIYYTTDGTTPTTSSSVYSSAIAVSSTKTIKALAVKSGMTNSEVASATYTINIPQVATPTFSPAAGTYSAAQSVTISCSTSGATIYYTTDGNDPTTSSSSISNGGTVNITESCTLKAMARYNNTNSLVSSAAYVINSGSSTPTTTRYVKITSTDDLTSGEKYLIVYEGGPLAFNGSLTSLDAVSNGFPVTIEEDTNKYIEATSDIDSKSFTITDADPNYYIQAASGYWIGRTSNSNGMDSANNNGGYKNSISFTTDGNVNIVGSGGAYLRYNSTSGQNRFRYFKSSTYTGQKAIALYKRVEATAEVIEVPISSALYGTLYYGEKNLIVPENVTAFTYTYNANGVPVRSHTYASGDVIPAGTGVVLATSGAATFDFVVTTESGTADADNYLRGSDTNATTTGGARYYKLSLNSAQEAGSIGWYWGANNGAAFTNGAHKAYLMMPASVASYSSVMGFPFSGETTGIDAIDNAQQPTAANKEVYTLDGRKVNNATSLKKGIYIVNGKKVVIR